MPAEGWKEMIGHPFQSSGRGRVRGIRFSMSRRANSWRTLQAPLHSLSNECVIHSANMSSAQTMCQALGMHLETKQKIMPALVGLLFKWGETNDKHVVSGFENGPETCVVQMITVSAFANITEPNNENITKPNQRLFNKNNFAIISSFDLMTADLLITQYIYRQSWWLPIIYTY